MSAWSWCPSIPGNPLVTLQLNLLCKNKAEVDGDIQIIQRWTEGNAWRNEQRGKETATQLQATTTERETEMTGTRDKRFKMSPPQKKRSLKSNLATTHTDIHLTTSTARSNPFHNCLQDTFDRYCEFFFRTQTLEGLAFNLNYCYTASVLHKPRGWERSEVIEGF